MALLMAFLSFAMAEEPTALLQLSKKAFCSCGEDCLSMAEAKRIMLSSCKEQLCRRSVEAAFAGRDLEKKIDMKTCRVLQDAFHLSLISDPRSSRVAGRWRDASDPSSITIEGDNNTINIDNSNSGNTVAGNMGPTDSNNVFSVGSGNLVPSSNEVVIIPVGSGNIVITPIGSGNIVITPVGSGNLVSVPSGSATVNIVPTGSGNSTTAVGSKFFVPIGSAIILNNTGAESTTAAPTIAPRP